MTQYSYAISSVGFGYAATYQSLGGGVDKLIDFSRATTFGSSGGFYGPDLALGRTAGLTHNQAGQGFLCDWEAGNLCVCNEV